MDSEISVAKPHLPPTSLVLFRCTDLRIHDNPALSAASREGRAVVPAFVWSRKEDGYRWGIRGASEVYLKAALGKLVESVKGLGSQLIFCFCDEDGPSSFADEVRSLALEVNAASIHYTIEHTPEGLARDAAMTAASPSNITMRAHESQLLYAPTHVSMASGFNGGHWGTLMPFLKACGKVGPVRRCLPSPRRLPTPKKWPRSCGLDGLGLAVMPAIVDWGATIRATWRAGEEEAMSACKKFVETGMLRYEKDRSRADLFSSSTPSMLTSTSRLSVALRFGELSPRYLYWAIRDAELPREVTKTFARRLHWRDLAYYHLAAFPDMQTRGIRKHYDETRWVGGSEEYARRLECWQRGKTGYPIVDAGMRELYLTGWMSQSGELVPRGTKN